MKDIKNIIDLNLYITLISIGLLITGLFLSFYCIFLDIPILRVHTMSNPLFYLIFGLGLLSFRLFNLIEDGFIDMEEEE